jgi:DNA polymerase-3 subunit epsilon
VPIHGILKVKKKNNRDRRNNTILDFIKDAVLVGHHVSFDVKMINEGLKRMGLGKLKNRSIDTDRIYQNLKGCSRINTWFR